MLLARSVISVLCAVGFYASVFMLRKSMLARADRLTEPSVVQTARAKIFGGIPNALIGCVYYAALVAVSWLAHSRAIFALALAASICAAATSVFLAYSLLYVTRRSCPYCWTAHAVNWALVTSVPWLLVLK